VNSSFKKKRVFGTFLAFVNSSFKKKKEKTGLVNKCFILIEILQGNSL
jgi:hypothetical protein